MVPREAVPQVAALTRRGASGSAEGPWTGSCGCVCRQLGSVGGKGHQGGLQLRLLPL